MGIRFTCPRGHQLHVKSFLAGRHGICPDCGVRLRVPLQSTLTGRRPARALRAVQAADGDSLTHGDTLSRDYGEVAAFLDEGVAARPDHEFVQPLGELDEDRDRRLSLGKRRRLRAAATWWVLLLAAATLATVPVLGYVLMRQ